MMKTATEESIVYARTLPDAVDCICDLVGVRYMAPSERLFTREEAKDYVVSGDVGAGRALLQHAKARREFGQNSKRPNY